MAEGWAGSTRRARLPRDWAKRRARILERDAGRCHVCKGFGADAVDHLVAGDNHSDENLAAIHHNVLPFCHRKKTAAERPRAQRPPESHPGLKW
ncbi:MAG: HNH endonuclease [Acidimicrobiales bacterium]